MEANPYESPRISFPVRERRLDGWPRTFVISAALGVSTGLILFEIVSVLGAKGLPVYGFYLYGPAVFLAPLGLADESFILTFRIAMSVVWAASWLIILTPKQLPRRLYRAAVVVSAYVGSVGVFHAMSGLP